MSNNTHAAIAAQHAYEVAKAVREAQGATDLPDWSQIPDAKKGFFTDAARAAFNGQPVWEVWALSCGEKPNDATNVLWRQKPALLQLIPKIFCAFCEAVTRMSFVSVVPASELDLLGDGVPSLEEGEDPIASAVEEHGLGAEEVSEAITKVNESRKGTAK